MPGRTRGMCAVVGGRDEGPLPGTVVPLADMLALESATGVPMDVVLSTSNLHNVSCKGGGYGGQCFAMTTWRKGL